MKILANVSRAHYTGGMELSVLHTTAELSRRGHEIHLFYGEAGPLLPHYEQFCASITQLAHWDFFFPEQRHRELIERAKFVPTVYRAARTRPDVYYVNRTFAADWALSASALNRAPVVCHWRGGWVPPARYLPRLRKKISRFLANSAYTRDCWLAAGFAPERTDVVYPGLDLDRYRAGGELDRQLSRRKLGIPEDAFVAAFVGRLDPSKGVEVLLDAWRRLGAGPSEAQLLVVGEPVVSHDPAAYLAKLKELAPAAGVRFLGATPDVVTPMHASDVVVVPSVNDEPFGRVVAEGLATGRPVIGSRSGGIPEILSGDLTRFLYERHDAGELASKLESVMDWRRREPSLAAACRDRVAREFTLEAMAGGVERNLRLALGT